MNKQLGAIFSSVYWTTYDIKCSEVGGLRVVLNSQNCEKLLPTYTAATQPQQSFHFGHMDPAFISPGAESTD